MSDIQPSTARTEAVHVPVSCMLMCVGFLRCHSRKPGLALGTIPECTPQLVFSNDTSTESKRRYLYCLVRCRRTKPQALQSTARNYSNWYQLPKRCFSRRKRDTCALPASLGCAVAPDPFGPCCLHFSVQFVARTAVQLREPQTPRVSINK
jgi:hypothetical protein